MTVSTISTTKTNVPLGPKVLATHLHPKTYINNLRNYCRANGLMSCAWGKENEQQIQNMHYMHIQRYCMIDMILYDYKCPRLKFNSCLCACCCRLSPNCYFPFFWTYLIG